MRWSLFLLFLGLLQSCSTPSSKETATTTLNDSIQYWANTANDNEDLPLKERFALVQRAYAKNQQVSNKADQVKNLSRISLAFSELADTLNFKKTNKELMRLAQAIGDPIAQGEAHWDLGIYFRPPTSFWKHLAKKKFSTFFDFKIAQKSI